MVDILEPQASKDLRDFKRKLFLIYAGLFVVIALIGWIGFSYRYDIKQYLIGKEVAKIQANADERVRLAFESAKANNSAKHCEDNSVKEVAIPTPVTVSGISETKPKTVVVQTPVVKSVSSVAVAVNDKELKKEIKDLEKKVNFCQRKRKDLWETLKKERYSHGVYLKKSDVLDQQLQEQKKQVVDQQEIPMALCNFNIDNVVVDSKKFPLANSELRCKNWTDLEAQKRGLVPVYYSVRQ